jgi:hypothetical protein
MVSTGDLVDSNGPQIGSVFQHDSGEPKQCNNKNMEALIFAAIAIRNGYAPDEPFVPEPAKFKPLDLHALKDLDSRGPRSDATV